MLEATAVGGYGTPQSKATTYSLTAVEAINKVPINDAGVASVLDKFLNNTVDFFG